MYFPSIALQSIVKVNYPIKTSNSLVVFKITIFWFEIGHTQFRREKKIENPIEILSIFMVHQSTRIDGIHNSHVVFLMKMRATITNLFIYFFISPNIYWLECNENILESFSIQFHCIHSKEFDITWKPVVHALWIIVISY